MTSCWEDRTGQPAQNSQLPARVHDSLRPPVGRDWYLLVTKAVAGSHAGLGRRPYWTGAADFIVVRQPS